MNRKYSLKKNHEIDKLVKIKRSVGNKYYAIYFSHTYDFDPKIVVSPTKRFRTAVERNYEKRVVKEILRELLPKLNNLRILLVIKTPAQELSFIQKREQILYLFKKMNKEEK